MPDVPRGSLFIGDEVEAADHKRKNSFIMYEVANLTTHGVIVGMTGSGKTGLGVVLLEECLLQGVPVLVLDPKGDMGNLMLTFPGRSAGEFRPYVLEADAKRDGLDQQAEAIAKQWTDGQESWGIDAARVKALHDAANEVRRRTVAERQQPSLGQLVAGGEALDRQRLDHMGVEEAVEALERVARAKVDAKETDAGAGRVIDDEMREVGLAGHWAQ